jgi:predicted deacylase
MIKRTIYSMPSGYRTDLTIEGYCFGSTEHKTVAIVGSMRGNEVQQLYVCSQLVKILKKLESQGKIRPECGIEVIPCVNPFSVNIGERFWAMDGTDINRMFPGYDKGETTQRIASGVFTHLQGFDYGIQFASHYLRGEFMPHVGVIKTDFSDTESARAFGLPYVVVRHPKPIDTTTLNYNWQIWNTKAYTVITRSTERLDIESAKQGVTAILRFLANNGLIDDAIHGGHVSSVLNHDALTVLRAPAAGIYRPLVTPGQQVHAGDVLADILHPCEGHVLERVVSPIDATVFFAFDEPLVMQRQLVFELIREWH